MADHHHHHMSVNNFGGVMYLSIALNLIYTILEFIFGFIYDSMGLLSDAGHNLSDVASLLLALFAYKISNRKPSSKYTYGFGKATIEASFFNAVILYVTVAFILFESVKRILNPVAIEGSLIAWIAVVGVIVNGVTTFMLLRFSHTDLNAKGAFLHMMADTLVSVGVVLSGIVINYTGIYVIDPIVGIIIAIVIAISSFSLFKESLNLSLDAVPASINIEEIKKIISSTPKVESFHHLHIWPLSTTQIALTVHVVAESIDDVDEILQYLHAALENVGINHSTIEVESPNSQCNNKNHICK
ncbi:MAG: cation diffusion facilitator family transporter [Candidatus Aphodosoma sp.]